jgi:hypothetical protein
MNLFHGWHYSQTKLENSQLNKQLLIQLLINQHQYAKIS